MMEGNMKKLEEYAKEFGITEIVNDYGEHRKTLPKSRIIFPNGWCASIVNKSKYSEEPLYSVALCDYNGYFDWSTLVKFGSEPNGVFLCKTEDEIIKACEVIRQLSDNGL